LKINSIELRNFRSYQKRAFSFDPSGNLLIGPNGSGKTNLLEAIAYTSIGKSIRYHKDEELLAKGEDFFALEAEYAQDSGNALRVQLSFDGSRKSLKLDTVLNRQLSSLLGIVKVIYSAPDDIQLINGSPRNRRQYFDMAVSQLFPEYLGTLRAYLHVVEQRNALLKQSFNDAQISSWDQRFALTLVDVYVYRKRYLDLLNRAFRESYANISDTYLDLAVEYRAVLKDGLDTGVERILQNLTELRSREKTWQRCLTGAHLDDYSFRFGEHGMRAFGSGGQKRIAVIILKLVQARLIEEHTHIHPVMLFDDIFAELDHQHSMRIKELCNDRFQSIIAGPKDDLKQIFHGYPEIRLGVET